jgi:hypothetical protein
LNLKCPPHTPVSKTETGNIGHKWYVLLPISRSDLPEGMLSMT